MGSGLMYVNAFGGPPVPDRGTEKCESGRFDEGASGNMGLAGIRSTGLGSEASEEGGYREDDMVGVETKSKAKGSASGERSDNRGLMDVGQLSSCMMTMNNKTSDEA